MCYFFKNCLIFEFFANCSYSNPPQRRNTTQQLDRAMSQKTPTNQGVSSPPRPHSTMVDHDKFARMRLGSITDVSILLEN